jgi:GMP synthase (glutamine-hydrolysing)
MHETVIVLDFGSQVTQLIARRVREAGVFCAIHPCTKPFAEYHDEHIKGIILSGGPASVYAEQAPTVDTAIFESGIPILGICYGMQLTAYLNGGAVQEAEEREFGRTDVLVDATNALFEKLPAQQVVWMSHGDRLEHIPGASVIAKSEHCPLAAVHIPRLHFHGLQFHPEVVHTEHGTAILRNFLSKVCGCRGDWRMGNFIDEETARIREWVGSDRVLLGLSGGVDSSVAAMLIHKAIGPQLTCVFVNNGLLRKDEADSVQVMYREHLADADFIYVDASERFLACLAGVDDPECKRKLIGHEFINVFRDEAEKIKERSGGAVRFLAQGTLYPDVIESISVHGGPAAVIKSHHNVGGLPEDLDLDLLEPFRYLFKDEVRAVGTELGLDDSVVWRQPFPGPGLAVRICSAITSEKVRVLQEADAIVREEIDSSGLARDIWQYFAVLLPVRSVGVMGDARTYENVCAIRAITATDGMTADWAKLPYDLLGRMSNRIINEVKGINRVCYDISSKPPATIEWE